jgi:hypothetical protein
VPTFEPYESPPGGEAKLSGPESTPGWFSLSVKGSGAWYDITIWNPAIPFPKITSQWDDNASDKTLGPFLYDVKLENQFTIRFPVDIPPALKVEYRLGNTGSWLIPDGGGSEWTFTKQIAELPAGSTDVNVRVLDPQGRLLYDFKNAVGYSIHVRDDIELDLQFADPSGQFWDAEQVRFIYGLFESTPWKVKGVGSGFPVVEAYKDHDFAMVFKSRITGNTHLKQDLSQLVHLGGGKFQSTFSLTPGIAFQDLIPGPTGFDYDVTLVEVRTVPTGYLLGKPFADAEKVFVTRLPEWMGTNAKGSYKQTDVFGPGTYEYVIDVKRLELDKSLPTTAKTPLGLFDGLETYLRSGVDLRVYARPTIGSPAPEVHAEKWSAAVKVLDQFLVSETGEFFPKSKIGQLEPWLLGLTGGGLRIVAPPKPLAKNLTIAKRPFTGFDITVPLASAGVAGIDARLALHGTIDVKATELNLSAALHLIDKGGQLKLEEEGSYVQLGLKGSAELELEGSASLGISAAFTPPAGLSAEAKKELEALRLKLIEFVAKGSLKANLSGVVQANFAGWPPNMVATYDRTNVVLSGDLKLWYEVCLLNNLELRQALGLKPCPNPDAEPDYDKPFGPKTIFGKELVKPDANNPASFSQSGAGLGAGSGSGGAGNAPPPAGPSAEVPVASFAASSPPPSEPSLPTGGPRGTLQVSYPFDSRLKGIRYGILAASDSAVPTVGNHVLEAVLIGGDDVVVIDQVDLASLTYQPSADPLGFSSGLVPRAVTLPGNLRDDRAYFLQFRLYGDPSVSGETVNVTLDDFQYQLFGPQLAVHGQSGSLSDGSVDFGADTNGGAVARLEVKNAGERSLNIASVQVVGEGFALLDPPPGEVSLPGGSAVPYRLRLLNPDAPAHAVLRIASNDPAQESFDLQLDYDGTAALDRVAPAIGDVRLRGRTWDAGLPFQSLLADSNSRFDSLSWPDVDQVQVVFGEDVDVGPKDLTLFANNQAAPATAEFQFDPATRTATWTLDTPLQTGGFLLQIDDRVSDRAGNGLDGEWTMGAGQSGDGSAGGQFQFRFNVLVGDATDDGNVGADDISLVQGAVGINLGEPGYSVSVDIDGDGRITSSDAALVQARMGDTAWTVPASPVIQPLGAQTVQDDSTLVVPVSATNPSGIGRLVFSLTEGPAYAMIDPDTGVVQWTPPERFPAGIFTFRVQASVEGLPELNCTETFAVSPQKTNQLPALAALTDQTVVRGDTLEFFVSATDQDFPAQRLTYALDPNAPAGASVDPVTGRFLFSPVAGVPAGTYDVTVSVVDDGTPAQRDSRTFRVTLVDTNVPPRLELIGSRQVDEGELLTFTAAASDPDGDSVSFRLGDGAPAGATIDAQSGMFAWTPAEEDGPGVHPVFVEVVDGRDSTLVDQELVLITVNEVNRPPLLTLPDDLTVPLGSDVAFTAQAFDADVPAGFLTFGLAAGAPAEARISASTGEFSWTPSSEGTFSITVQVTDWRTPRQDVFDTITVTVGPDNVAPTLNVEVIPRAQAPFAAGWAQDNFSALAAFRARFTAPATGFADLSLWLEADGSFFLHAPTLEQILGEPLTEGTYDLQIQAEDAAGNVATADRTFTVDMTPPVPPTLGLAPASDTDPAGDDRTRLAVVDLVGHTEAAALVRLSFGSEFASERFGETLADADGEFTFGQVPLAFGANNLYLEAVDAAGNVAATQARLTRLTADGRHGPDGFGYLAEAMPPAFVDISATGQRVPVQGYEPAVLTPTELGEFQFEFYGTSYDTFYVGSHGAISFGQGVYGGPLSFEPEFFQWPEAATAAPFWAELGFSDEPDSAVFWELQDGPEGRRLIVQWNELTAWAASDPLDPITFQAVLDAADGSIQFNYRDLDAGVPSEAGSLGAVGIKHSGVQAEGRALLQLSVATAPHDLVDTGLSTRISRLAETLAPILDAHFAGPVIEGKTREPAVAGLVLDASEITQFRAGFDGLPSAGYTDLLASLQFDGTFSLDAAQLAQIYGGDLPDGPRVLHLVATDATGRTSAIDVGFDLDANPPTVSRIELHRDFDSPPIGDRITDRPSVTLVGQTEPFARLYLERLGSLDFAEAGATGEFEFLDVSLDPGDNHFLLTAWDVVGHETTLEWTITHEPGISTNPDGDGYWAHSVTPVFEDISSSGHRVLVGEDDAFLHLTAAELDGFRFRFYGTEYQELFISTNGVITFGAGTLEKYFQLADSAFPGSFAWPEEAAIAPLVDDFVVSGSVTSAVYWQVRNTPQGKQLIVQWNEVAFAAGGLDGITFQAVLNGWDDSIQFNYLDLNTGDDYTEGWYSTAGIKGPGGQVSEERGLDLAPYIGAHPLVGTGLSTFLTSELVIVGAPRVRGSDLPAETASALSGITLDFDRAMDQASFALDDDLISFTGPGGDLRSQITGFSWLDTNTMRIDFVPQTDDGSYTLVLGPHITARPDGIAMDQDGDGIAGESPDDRYELTVVLNRCVGPNAAGYEGCSASFEDIDLTAGAPGVFVIVDEVDDGAAAIDLGANTFRFYDAVVTGASQLFVSTNGLISLGSEAVEPNNTDLSTGPSQAAIAPLWDDWLTYSDQADVVLGKFEDITGDDVADRLIVEWSDVQHWYGDRRAATFQAILELNTEARPGDITFNYRQLNVGEPLVNNGAEGTVGIKGVGEQDGDPLLLAFLNGDSPLLGSGRAIRVSSVSPVAEIAMIAANPRNTAVGEVSIAFSSPVTGVSSDDFRLTRDGEDVSLTSLPLVGGGEQYTLDLSAVTLDQGEYVLTLQAAGSSIMDLEGRLMKGDARVTWAVDRSAPTASFAAIEPNVRNEPVGAVTITFSEPVTGVDLADLWLTQDGQPVDLTGLSLAPLAPNAYVVDLTTVSGLNGSYEFVLQAVGSAILDRAGNALATGASASWTVDRVAPGGVLAPLGNGPRNTPVGVVCVTFSEPVTGVGLSDFSLTRNGQPLDLQSLTVTALSAAEYEVDLTSVTGEGGSYLLVIQGTGSGIQDFAGNLLSGSFGHLWATDLVAPGAMIVPISPDPRPAGTGVVTIVFAEAVTGVDLTDLSLIRNGQVVDLHGLTLRALSPSRYAVDLTSATAVSGSYVLRLAATASGIHDLAENALTAEAEDAFRVSANDGSGLWQNAAEPCDVTGEGHVTPLDVLSVINYINANPGHTSLPAAPALPPPFYDVNGDDEATSLDALLVINHINANPPGSPEAEPPESRVAEGVSNSLTATPPSLVNVNGLPAPSRDLPTFAFPRGRASDLPAIARVPDPDRSTRRGVMAERAAGGVRRTIALTRPAKPSPAGRQDQVAKDHPAVETFEFESLLTDIADDVASTWAVRGLR